MSGTKSKRNTTRKTVKTRSPAQKANDLKLKNMHSMVKIMNAPSKYVKSVATKSNSKKAAGLAGLIAALGAGYLAKRSYDKKNNTKGNAAEEQPVGSKGNAVENQPFGPKGNVLTLVERFNKI